MKRRIIRSFFISLLLLLMIGWVGSYKYGFGLQYVGDNRWCWGSYKGQLCYTWFLWRVGIPQGWDGGISGDDVDMDLENEHSKHFLGFGLGKEDEIEVVIIPFWFPTTISAALLWLVCRKTRPRPDPKTAFPVELAKPSEKP